MENGQKYTVKELAERLEVSKRMIKIYKSELEKAGIYIETLYGPYGGYVYNHKNNYDIEFNYSDIDNIENILNKLSQKEKNNINITLEKIKTLVIYSVNVDKKIAANDEEIKNRYTILSNAIINKKNVTLIYHKKNRIFLPYTFSFYKNLIYTTGFSYTDNDIRTFNLAEIKDLKKFHGIMTKYLVEECGEFRHGEEGVFNGDECIFMAPPAQFVPQLMDELFEWMKKSRNSVHPLIMSSVFHYEFVFIHPFADGNGRMARLWHTAILAKWKPVFEYIPIESQIEKFQDEYYDAIARCHVSGESTIFIEFMLSQIDRILEDISLHMNEENEQFSETVRKMLEIMEYDTPYTRKTLMEKLGLKSRDGFRRNYLQPALEMNLIQMTLPDKPNSRNQRYMKE